jgi:hypothetical protein
MIVKVLIEKGLMGVVLNTNHQKSCSLESAHKGTVILSLLRIIAIGSHNQSLSLCL